MLFVRLFDLYLFGFADFLFLGVWEGLRFVIVALSGLFSYLFFLFAFLHSQSLLKIVVLLKKTIASESYRPRKCIKWRS